MFFVEPIRNFYGRFERPISSLSLIAGFVFDALTLKRVDTLWENMWVLAHLVIVGVFIILIHVKEKGIGDETNPSKAHFWYVNILQFFFGGILSTYLVFYFRSADILVTWPFIVLLALAFIANESLKRHYTRLSFQISLFFLSIYSFAIFIVPVIFRQIGPKIFVLSGLVSLVFIFVFVKILLHYMKKKSNLDRVIVSLLIIVIFAIVNMLYFTNLIPPIPLSLKDAGMYHSIQKTAGGYIAEYEDLGLAGYFQFYPTFSEVVGKSVYAYSAIFSPSNLNLAIVHEWQYYDESSRQWITQSRVELPVIGGRDGGFRTYSDQYDLAEGKWRVNVETEQGQIIGRLRFNVKKVEVEPTLTSEVK